ncbi:hypothetical protein BJ684DRAFT_19404 [Piptocephalis cylindrospora]|uniref:Uncharacterized protein n=1 Tax=Piptocephalis cylindrospora TaxID=1907219 RepID=A0A4P9Y585_9FUNG|nr:hypothetical protein BJ684DRAFT_19404 [Piptocephalis cylindrospora]|eukprot:RKP14168.1 hypothetical protein BJ684DRAFT_19404 [Piptocephalis cylindrospora]
MSRWSHLSIQMEREERWRRGRPCSWYFLDILARGVVVEHINNIQRARKNGPIHRFRVAGEVMVTLSAAMLMEVWRWKQSADGTMSFSLEMYLPFGPGKKWFYLCPSGRRLVAWAADKGISFWTLTPPASNSQEGEGSQRRYPLFHQPWNFSQGYEIPVTILGDVYVTIRRNEHLSVWEHKGGKEILRWKVEDQELFNLRDTLLIPRPRPQGDLPVVQHVMVMIGHHRIWVYDGESGARIQDILLEGDVPDLGEGVELEETLLEPRFFFSSGRRLEDKRETYVCMAGKAYILQEEVNDKGDARWKVMGLEIIEDSLGRSAVVAVMNHDRALVLTWSEEEAGRTLSMINRRASPRSLRPIQLLFEPSAYNLAMDGRCIYFMTRDGLEIYVYSFDPMMPLSYPMGKEEMRDRVING